MIFKGKNKEYLQLDKVNTNNCSILNEEIESSLTLVWFVKGETQLNIDGKFFSFKENQIITLTEFNKINVIKIDELCLVRFNRSFYCIAHNDSEVGCKGLLFLELTNYQLLTYLKTNKKNLIFYGECSVLKWNQKMIYKWKCFK